MKRLLVLLLVLLAPGPAWAADPLVADLSSSMIAVTSGFTGTEVLIFGAINGPADIAVMVEGPPASITVRQKTRQNGLWLNGATEKFAHAPSYYVLATSLRVEDLAPASILIDQNLDLTYKIDPAIYRQDTERGLFRDALIHDAEKRGVYQIMPGAVKIIGHRLFRVGIQLPALAPIGDYTVHILLFHNGEVIANHTLPLSLQEEGLNATIYRTAHSMPVLYALAVLLLMLGIGGGSTILFRKAS
jgi:uncharacterized protein (TIGR02186 family)